MRARARLIALCLCTAAPAAAQDVPRAVSLDYCADQFLIALADPDQIAGVSPGADGDYAYLRETARGLPQLRPVAEEIAPRRPDVVFRFWGGGPRLAQTLERVGARVVTFKYAADFDAVRANIRTAAEALERRARGEALIAELDARLAALARRGTNAAAALYVTPGGVTAGAGTMVDAIFAAAGVDNAAAEAGLAGWPPLPVETLILDPPEAVVAGFFTLASERASNWSAARHPAFEAVFEKARVIHLPADLLSCPAWFSVEAAERIAAGLGSPGDRHAAE